MFSNIVRTKLDTTGGGPRGVRPDRELGRDRQHNQDMTIAENVRISIGKCMVSKQPVVFPMEKH